MLIQRQKAGLGLVGIALVAGIVALSMSETIEVEGVKSSVIFSTTFEMYGGEMEACSDWYLSSEKGKDGKNIRKTWIANSQDRQDCKKVGGKIGMQTMQKGRKVPYPIPLSYLMITCLFIFAGGAVAFALPVKKKRLTRL